MVRRMNGSKCAWKGLARQILNRVGVCIVSFGVQLSSNRDVEDFFRFVGVSADFGEAPA